MQFTKKELKLQNIKYINMWLWIGIASILILLITVPFEIYCFYKVNNTWNLNLLKYENCINNSKQKEVYLLKENIELNKLVGRYINNQNLQVFYSCSILLLLMGAFCFGYYFICKRYLRIIEKYKSNQNQ